MVTPLPEGLWSGILGNVGNHNLKQTLTELLILKYYVLIR